MAIFELDGEAPDLPPDGRYWIADSAIVIGAILLVTEILFAKSSSEAVKSSS